MQVFQVCDRVNLIQDGVITFDKPTSETSVAELNEIVVEQYRRARQEAQRAMAGMAVDVNAARAAVRGGDVDGDDASDAPDDSPGDAPAG